MAGLFGAILGSSDVERGIENSKDLLKALEGSVETGTGMYISPEASLRYTTVLACVRVLSESLASLPCILYRRRKDGGKDRATDHPLYRVLHDQASAWNTSYEYFEGQMINLATRGNGYAYVQRDNLGRCEGLVPLNPDPVTIEQARDYSPIYTVTLPNNMRKRLKPSEIHHLRGPMPKGYVGQSLISLAREAIGLGMAAEKFGAHLYRNGVKPSGVLKTTQTVGGEAIESLRTQFETKYGGLSNSSRPLILEEGMEWVALSINPDDAQFLETRAFQRTEITGIFRVPAHMIGDLSRSTNNNIEHQSLEFVNQVLRPWAKRIEARINQDLLAPDERDEYFAEFLFEDILRGDFKTRMEGYSILVQNKIMSANEVRGRENMNPYEGGDVYENPAIQVNDNAPEPAKPAPAAAA